MLIQTATNARLDARLAKVFSFGGVSMRAYIYAHNVLNQRNVVNVYYRTGLADDDGYLTGSRFETWVAGSVNAYGENFVRLYQAINLDHRQHYWRHQGGDLFGRPREIRFGLEFVL